MTGNTKRGRGSCNAICTRCVEFDCCFRRFGDWQCSSGPELSQLWTSNGTCRTIIPIRSTTSGDDATNHTKGVSASSNWVSADCSDSDRVAVKNDSSDASTNGSTGLSSDARSTANDDWAFNVRPFPTCLCFGANHFATNANCFATAADGYSIDAADFTTSLFAAGRSVR